MPSRRALSLVALAVAPVHIASDQSASGQICGGNAGPDIVVADVIGVSNYAAVSGIDAFSIGDNACNVGTQNVIFIANSNQHPVMAQNLYRHKVVGGTGRFERADCMIGAAGRRHFRPDDVDRHRAAGQRCGLFRNSRQARGAGRSRGVVECGRLAGASPCPNRAVGVMRPVFVRSVTSSHKAMRESSIGWIARQYQTMSRLWKHCS